MKKIRLFSAPVMFLVGAIVSASAASAAPKVGAQFFFEGNGIRPGAVYQQFSVYE